MTNLTKSNFQAHPFHLVSPSLWPVFTCVALLTLTNTGVLTAHGFSNAQYFLILAFASVGFSVGFWLHDFYSTILKKAYMFFIIIIISHPLIVIILLIYVTLFCFRMCDEIGFYNLLMNSGQGSGGTGLPPVGGNTNFSPNNGGNPNPMDINTLLNPSNPDTPILQSIRTKMNYRTLEHPNSVNASIYTNLTLGPNNHNCNLTLQERDVLSSVVKRHGIDSTRPYFTREMASGIDQGVTKVARLRDGYTRPGNYASYITITPNTDFKRFLNWLIERT